MAASYTSSERPAIGGSNTRVDSAGKVTGRTRYVDDLRLPGLLHMAVLRSPHHHARVLKIDGTAAQKLPGVVRVITAADIPGVNSLTDYSRDEPLLTPVGDTAKQRGAPIALIVAESLRQARAALKAIEVDYEVLPHTFDADEALKPDAYPIYPGGNVLNAYTIKHGELDAAFAASDVIVETEYLTRFQEHSALERESSLAYIDEAGRLTVTGGTHEPHWQVGYIAPVLGVDADRVRFIMPPTGGSFGGRQDPWPHIAVALATHLLRRPVRLTYSRRESFDATPKRHPYRVRHKIGATRDGRFTGIQVRIVANTGAYDSAGYWIPNYAVTASGGAYRWQAVDAFAQSVYTNGPKCGQFRGFGSPQSSFALECALDELAQQLNIDPLELRYANRLQQDAISFLGYPVAESLGYAEVLDAIRPRYHAYRAEADQFNAANEGGPYRMGVGLAGMWYRFGKSGSLRVETHAELARDGHFIVYCSAPDYGQGTDTVMTQLAAETLGVSRDRVELVNADTALTPDSGIQGASRATYFVGNSVRAAADNLKQAIFAVAAELLDQSPAELALKDDRVVGSAPDRSIGLDAVAREFDQLGKSRRVIGIFDLSPQFPDETRPEYTPHIVTGAQAAQVLVDEETGLVQVRRLAAAHDVGRAINPPSTVGQIEGAVMMGVGTALSEEYIPGVSTGFTDYLLPMASARPEIEVLLIEVPSFFGPFGAKGVGEGAILPTAPAILNALSRAIGVRVRELPMTPPRVLAAIKSRGR